MKHRFCIQCNRLHDVHPDMWRFIDHKGPYACSVDCIEGWIRSHNVTLCADRHLGWIEPNPDREGAPKSQYEERVIETLRSLGLTVWYEPFIFRVSETRDTTWRPDLFFPDHPCFIEVKGPWAPSARKKLEGFRRIYGYPILVVSWAQESLFPFDRPDLRLV